MTIWTRNDYGAHFWYQRTLVKKIRGQRLSIIYMHVLLALLVGLFFSFSKISQFSIITSTSLMDEGVAAAHTLEI